ncbi:Rha family transcriptional regulator [Kozakia baliensis]|uniref:Rha family transcriptional regulator n=1 Tax=Kozakia baliensis TaxID=153496 RepID=UPI00191C5A1D|nr:Rha family transcriptional regulator [Kozakia baliensis]
MPSANSLINTNPPVPTMSSREIAELTGGSHDNVLKTVRGLINRGIVFGNDTPYVHPQNGQVYHEILLDYRNTMVVISGYSPELRAKIIDRWIELEGGNQHPDITTTLLAAREAIELIKPFLTGLRAAERRSLLSSTLKLATGHDLIPDHSPNTPKMAANRQETDEPDEWEPTVESYLTDKQSIEIRLMDVAEHALNIKPDDVGTKVARRIGAIMRKLGWERTHTRTGKLWVKRKSG